MVAVLIKLCVFTEFKELNLMCVLFVFVMIISPLDSLNILKLVRVTTIQDIPYTRIAKCGTLVDLFQCTLTKQKKRWMLVYEYCIFINFFPITVTILYFYICLELRK